MADDAQESFSSWAFCKVALEGKTLYSIEGADGTNIKWCCKEDGEEFCLLTGEITKTITSEGDY